MKRRELLKLALGSAIGATLPIRLARVARGRAPAQDGPPFTPIAATSRDELVLAPEFAAQWERIAAAGDDLGAEVGTFGEGCDHLEFLPIDRLKFPADPRAPQRGFASERMSSREGLLVVNHESLEPRIFHSPTHANWKPGDRKSEEQLLAEMRALGLSVIQVAIGTDGRWHRRKASPYTRRIDATTWCTLTGPAAAIDGGPAARGTFANCSGGATPWGTVLSCEENFHEFTDPTLRFLWPDEPYKNRRHYGWVVEVDPFDARRQPRKHTALGRFRHENVAIRVGDDGTLVAYMGDDVVDGCLYKFVADGKLSGDRAQDAKLLESGRLYAADVEHGRWLRLDHATQPALQRAFASQVEVLADARGAALALGATPLARPEDAEIHPEDGSLYVALTNHKKRTPPDLHGRIVRLVEQGGDPAATEFAWSDFAIGGPATADGGGGFSCPDNLLFDDAGNLWVTCDIATEALGLEPYVERGNNGLFFFRTRGPLAGRAFQAASAPVQAELTGPCLTPDGTTLFLSVQHPGEESKSRAELTSHWPEGGAALPRSAVIAIRGIAR